MSEDLTEKIRRVVESLDLPPEKEETLRDSLMEFMTDLNPNREALRAIEERQAQMHAILDTTVDGIITINERGIVESFNKAAERIFGYRTDEAKGRNVKCLMPSPYREQHDQYIDSYIRTGQAKIVGIGRQVAGQRKDGTIFPIDLAVSESRIGGRRLFTGIVRDITDRKRAEEAIVSVGEEVRRLVGQELHDALGQELTGLSLLAKTLENKLVLGNTDVSEEVATITELTRSATEQTRRLAHGLYPTVLERHGLVAALTELAEDQANLHHIDCKFEGKSESVNLSKQDQLNLYRIVQEAVHNAVKHGKTDRILVRLEEDDGNLLLSVTDDGIGLPEDADSREGMGLQIMRYRASALGAALSLQRRTEGGTEMICRMSLDTESKTHASEEKDEHDVTE